MEHAWPDERITMTGHYILLTGSRNNAGDFLIKHRAMALLRALRPDRELVDRNAWEPFADEELDEINTASAILLMGGPSFQQNMYPGIYAMTSQLDQLRVPIIAMGVGWKSSVGSWQDTHQYPLSDQTRRLLDRVRDSGHLSSVRDYHTLNAAAAAGYGNFLMTGRPAYYSLPHLNMPMQLNPSPRKVAFSMGVAMAASPGMAAQTREIVIALADRYGRDVLEVTFHHSLSDQYVLAYGQASPLFRAQREMATWLDSQGLRYVDISGSAENLIAYYESCDLHIGFRVHAHIFMSSISRPSVLLSEDGRGKAAQLVAGGVVLDAYLGHRRSTRDRILRKLRLLEGSYIPAPELAQDIVRMCDYEQQQGVRFGSVRTNIDRHYPVMQRFVAQLP